jgi:hypothetical protein
MLRTQLWTPAGSAQLACSSHGGDFFGELGLVAGERTAHDVARECNAPATCAVDVTSYLHRELAALARRRTQYPVCSVDAPQPLLQKMVGTEFFRSPPVAAGTPPPVASGRKLRAPWPASLVRQALLCPGLRPARRQARYSRWMWPLAMPAWRKPAWRLQAMPAGPHGKCQVRDGAPGLIAR